jgi:hypothetical protein
MSHPRTEQVPTEPLIQAMIDARLSNNELARRLGWLTPDGCRVRRMLAPEKTTSYSRAVEIIKLIGADPVDYGF